MPDTRHNHDFIVSFWTTGDEKISGNATQSDTNQRDTSAIRQYSN